MENADQAATSNEVRALREGIKRKYQVYHTLDKERFPAIEFNTNRANYEPLRQSFEEEFYVVRQISRVDNNLYIPSTNTLSQIFSNDNYLPSKKILNTCRSYAEGKSQIINDDAIQGKQALTTRSGKLLWLIGLVLLVGFVIYIAINYLMAPSGADGLTITTPFHKQTVPRMLTVEGKVLNADTVWLVVHPIARDKKYPFFGEWNEYYIQPPIIVDDNNTWKGKIYIGGIGKAHVGVRAQIRAFINPDKRYRVLDDYDRYVFHSWPKAELSTQVIEVVRGSDDN